MSAFNFDATQVKPDTGGGFTLVPKGSYTAAISGSEIKDTSAKNGRFIEANFKIIGGEFNGVIVKERINVENPSVEAQRIGLSKLSAICHATGVLKLTATEQLHGRPLTIIVDVEDYVKKNTTTGVDEPRQSNRITGYTKAEGATAGAPASAPPSFLTQPTAPPQSAPPVTAPVAPPVQPTPPPVAPVATLYYVSHKGQNITATPISSTEVLAMGLPVNEVMVCANGGTAWEPVSVLTPAPPTQPAAGTPPPWARA